MEPYAEGQALASAAVAMTVFFAFAIWSAANLKRTKCKLYEVLLVSAVGKTHDQSLEHGLLARLLQGYTGLES